MKLNRHRSRIAIPPEPMMDINTTPLIDIMLVLLIMLIITIPAQLHSISLDMPVSARKSEPSSVIRIEITPQDQIIWAGQPLASDELAAQMKSLALANQQPELHIHPQAGSHYKTLALILATAQRSGLKKLGVIGTEQFVR